MTRRTDRRPGLLAPDNTACNSRSDKIKRMEASTNGEIGEKKVKQGQRSMVRTLMSQLVNRREKVTRAMTQTSQELRALKRCCSSAVAMLHLRTYQTSSSLSLRFLGSSSCPFFRRSELMVALTCENNSCHLNRNTVPGVPIPPPDRAVTFRRQQTHYHRTNADKTIECVISKTEPSDLSSTCMPHPHTRRLRHNAVINVVSASLTQTIAAFLTARRT